MKLKLDSITSGLLDDTVKGFPGEVRPFALDEVAKQGWNILRQDLLFPVAVIKDEAVRSNSLWMRRFLEETGTLICPHGKTTMSPQLFQQQLDDGAWGITAATVSQVLVYRRFGVQRILLANQLLGRRNIRTIVHEIEADPDFDFYCLVDSQRGLEILTSELQSRPLGRPLQVFVEVGQQGARTGFRASQEALALARAVKASEPLLTLRGIEGFEGVLGAETMAATESKVERLFEKMRDVAEKCDREGLFSGSPVILSAGGSAFFDLAAHKLRAAHLSNSFQVVLRSGCYLTHDSKGYESFYQHLKRRTSHPEDLGDGLQPALEVWGCIQSMPEAGLALATMGKRDVSFDMGLPVPQWWFRPGEAEAPARLTDSHRVKRLDDQHAYLEIPAESPLRVGDLVGFGISHPCTTFDKWNVLFVVDGEYNVTSAIRTFF